jgi:hypothetical protein
VPVDDANVAGISTGLHDSLRLEELHRVRNPSAGGYRAQDDGEDWTLDLGPSDDYGGVVRTVQVTNFQTAELRMESSSSMDPF